MLEYEGFSSAKLQIEPYSPRHVNHGINYLQLLLLVVTAILHLTRYCRHSQALASTPITTRYLKTIIVPLRNKKTTT